MTENTIPNNPLQIIAVEHPLIDDLEADDTSIVTEKNYMAVFNPVLKAPTGISSARQKRYDWQLLSIISATIKKK